MVFRQKCGQRRVYQNAYYWVGRERKEADLLVIYDNKIFIIESKSGNLPLSAKREGKEMLETRLEGLVKKALSQCVDTKNYIKSQPKVTFWKDESKNNVLIEIDSASTNYEFFFIDVTLEHLGGMGTNLKNLSAFNFFQDGEYPWAVYLHDLDVITDLLSQPIYFIHYIQQRIAAQKQDVFESPLELCFLSYYLKNGTFTYEATNSKNAKMILAPGLIEPIEQYYVGDQTRPKLDIPRKLEELLLNMQKYRQKGFTNITSVLLDFPPERRKLIADSLEKKFNRTIKTGTPDGFMAVLGNRLISVFRIILQIA